MRTIWKYRLTFGFDEIMEIKMPDFAEIVHVETQDDYACMWAIVDTSTPLVTRRFIRVFTGSKLSDTISAFAYIGTYLIRGIVGHVFEIP